MSGDKGFQMGKDDWFDLMHPERPRPQMTDVVHEPWTHSLTCFCGAELQLRPYSGAKTRCAQCLASAHVMAGRICLEPAE